MLWRVPFSLSSDHSGPGEANRTGRGSAAVIARSASGSARRRFPVQTTCGKCSEGENYGQDANGDGYLIESLHERCEPSRRFYQKRRGTSEPGLLISTTAVLLFSETQPARANILPVPCLHIGRGSRRFCAVCRRKSETHGRPSHRTHRR